MILPCPLYLQRICRTVAARYRHLVYVDQKMFMFQQKKVNVLKPLPSMWKTWTELQASGFVLAHPQLFFWGVNQLTDLFHSLSSFSLSVTVPFKNTNSSLTGRKERRRREGRRKERNHLLLNEAHRSPAPQVTQSVLHQPTLPPRLSDSRFLKLPRTQPHNQPQPCPFDSLQVPNRTFLPTPFSSESCFLLNRLKSTHYHSRCDVEIKTSSRAPDGQSRCWQDKGAFTVAWHWISWARGYLHIYKKTNLCFTQTFLS